MERLLSKKEVKAIVGLSLTETARKERAGNFPLRVKNGHRVFYVESEIEAYVSNLISQRAPPPEKEDDAES
jgi:predicted DNA-binding transcriptional regulator AlpA